MKVPAGFFETLWSFVSFLPYFFLLFILGLLKAVIICPIVVGIIMIVNSAVIIGLWPAHFIWTLYCVLRTKRLGPVLKIVALSVLPVPLILWPIVGIVGSLLGGIGYGFFAPLIATFEAVGVDVTDKCYHCFADGCLSTIRGSYTAVQDFIDFCFHAYFSYMDELSEKVPKDEKPIDIKYVLSCLYQVIETAKLSFSNPGWCASGCFSDYSTCLVEESIHVVQRMEETVGGLDRQRRTIFGDSLCSICWSCNSVVASCCCRSCSSRYHLQLLSGTLCWSDCSSDAHNAQEDSLQMGLAYIVSVVSLFDEYVNDLLYLREGSCLPRPRYHRNMKTNQEKKKLGDDDNNDLRIKRESSLNMKLVSERSRTLRKAIQQYKPVQIWDWLFKSCEVNGRILLRDGLINIKDVEECIKTGNCKKLGIKLPAWSILQCLLISAKSDSSGLVISDDLELTRINSPRDKVFEWFIGPLLIIKEQIKKLQLDVNEEISLRKLVMEHKNEKPDDWDNSDFPSSDNVRKAQLQAIIRRLQGIVASMSRIPTFRRRIRNLVKILYIEAIQASASSNHIGGITQHIHNKNSSAGTKDVKDRDGTVNVSAEKKPDIGDMV
ncbi:uncharacterized membrane protein At3g27390 isoform X1 [Citrus sinensis]|uniref:uncharacterized membrane protein At3g27390 isoform X1 n=1 Tax=Citrus sinensis TaxID=2711 RepID=UPI0003D6F681|nr:uncharacterized membrane protein At3g27390 isoform X1 [Citrus sinensis]XP_024046981.1 uncharacterized membrane protein At3g27390 isoform X1 [Citrus x clementina]